MWSTARRATLSNRRASQGERRVLQVGRVKDKQECVGSRIHDRAQRGNEGVGDTVPSRQHARHLIDQQGVVAAGKHWQQLQRPPVTTSAP